jgi:preprotein translocase subunit SecG
MQTVLLVVHLIIAVILIGTILLQKSEGGALGIGGGGGGGNLFSARGVGNTLTRTTAILALAFFLTSLSLTMVSIYSRGGGGTLFGGPGAPATGQQAPAGSGGSVLPQLPGSTNQPQQQRPQVPVTP